MRHVRSTAAAIAILTLSCAGQESRKFPDPSELPVRPELPDLMTMLDGRPVATKAQWLGERRPELKALFQHYMYGYLPPPPARVEAAVRRTEPEYFGGKATLKELTLSFGPPGAPKIDLLMVVPNKRAGPAPIVLGINFHGNHTTLADPKVGLPGGWVPKHGPGVKDNRATDAGRGAEAAGWSIEASIDRGYAVATFYHGDLDPDRPDFTDGIHPHYFKEGQTQPGPHDWACIAAWAWGFHRAVDYLVTDKDVDRDRIAVFGHSRNGKTALLAAAFDDRIALALPHQAGCGGTAPSRTKNPKAETVKRINTAFPHWFNATFKRFNDEIGRLPFDQHGLAAICAPRPVLYTNAEGDQWADPPGQFEMLQAADKVYRLLGAGGLDADRMPETGKLVDSTLGYFIRPGKHSTTPEDWKVFLDFCDKNLKRK
jgi:hypothetical protein